MVRSRASTNQVTVFAEAEEPITTNCTAGIRRPLDVRIAAEADSLFVADYGALNKNHHNKAAKGSGVIWKIRARP